MGFEDLHMLARFLHVLPGLVTVTDYDLEAIARLLNAIDPPLDGPRPFNVPRLKAIARAWMDDMHDYCNVSGYLGLLGEAQTRFMLELREFRLARPWLRRNLGPRDRFDYAAPANGATLFRSLRHGPDGEQVYALIHMEGAPIYETDPFAQDVEGLERGGWRVALRTPPIGEDYQGGPLTLRDGFGVVFTRAGPGG
jgi:hypothetical protein